MKKKLLFVIPTLDLGGAEKSLVNLLQTIDYSQYEVDLFLFLKRGIFLSSVPKEVNFIKNSNDYYLFSKTAFWSVFIFLLKGKWCKAYHRLAFTVKNRCIKTVSIGEQRTWQHIKRVLPAFTKEYDAAIGYLEKSTYYFVSDNVKAKTKIGWIHTDLEALKINFDFEEKYFDKLNYLVIVSNGLKERLIAKIPSIKDKIFTIENINSPKYIVEMSQKETNCDFDSDFFNLIFIGRLVREKGLFMAIDAVEILLEQNKKVKLYLAGEGNLEVELMKYVKHKNLNDYIVFLGLQNNPYPLIRKSDVFLMTSFYEGKSIALEEAKMLSKPIVITNFSSAKDQIIDGETGLIAHMNAESVAEKILQLMQDGNLKQKLSENLEKEKLGNEREVEKLYELIR